MKPAWARLDDFKAGGMGLYSPTLSTSMASLKFPRLKGKLKKKVLLFWNHLCSPVVFIL